MASYYIYRELLSELDVSCVGRLIFINVTHKAFMPFSHCYYPTHAGNVRTGADDSSAWMTAMGA